MIYFLTLLTIYIWPFGQLLSFTLPNFSSNLYLLDISVFLVFISLLLSKDRKKIFQDSVLKPLLIFLGLAIFSFIINIKQGIDAGLVLSLSYLARLLVYPSLYFAVKHVGLTRLKKPLLISLGIFSLLSLIQYFFFPDMRYLKLIGFDDHYFRLIGSFYDPNFTGAVFAGVSLLFIAKNKFLHSLPFVVLLALTFSRASYLVFAVGLIYLLIKNKKTKLLFLLFLLGIVVYLIPKPFGEGVNLLRTFSIFSRFDSWKQGLTLFFQKPIFGWGYNNLRSADGSRFQVDNSFIFLLATTGFMGLIAFGNLLATALKNAKNQGAVIMIFSLLLHALFNNTLFYIWIFSLFWTLLAISTSKPTEYKKV